MPDLILPIVCLVLGIALGFILSTLFRSSKGNPMNNMVPKGQLEDKDLQLKRSEELNRSIQAQNVELNKDNATLEANLLNLQEKLEEQKAEFIQLNNQAQLQFKELANSILQEKTQTFKKTNQEELQHILKPLKENIQQFKQDLNQKFNQDAKDKGALQEAIANLQKMNQQLSADALSLTQALKGDNKTQGDWGEIQLEQILEFSGLQKGVHFNIQNSFKDELGQQKRPDFIINLPENRQIIIDCKVSLTAYDRYIAAEEHSDKDLALKQHLESIKSHIKNLQSKSYEQLDALNTTDYVMLFVPIEPALTLALAEDKDLYQYALDRNIILVSNTTLMATMRTVSFIWKKQNQEKNAKLIAKTAGQLYEKFVGFLEDLNDLGAQINRSQKSYNKALNKLSDSPSRGKTILGKIEQLKELGAETNKQLPLTQQQELNS
jgi:DNA recombination protein RmuC